MALSAKLEFRQGQQLVMTPQLQQAIRLLQLSNIELNAFVDAELERNPLLERDEDGDIGPRSQANGDAPESAASEEPRTSGETADLDFNETARCRCGGGLLRQCSAEVSCGLPAVLCVLL